MSRGSQFSITLARAIERAEKRYPKQPERARQMADSECGYENGPYALEPLTISQRIGQFFGWSKHVTD